MDEGLEYKQKLIAEYKAAAQPLLSYLPWLEGKAGETASAVYGGEDLAAHSLAFPVYDGTLMAFVKAAQQSPLMYRDYPYTYTRRNIKSHEDERRLIGQAGLQDWDLLRGILSKYVLGGCTKATLWSEAVKEQIFYLVLKQMKEIIEHWDKPMMF